jgi:hypothetical protein
VWWWQTPHYGPDFDVTGECMLAPGLVSAADQPAIGCDFFAGGYPGFDNSQTREGSVFKECAYSVLRRLS